MSPHWRHAGGVGASASSPTRLSLGRWWRSSTPTTDRHRRLQRTFENQYSPGLDTRGGAFRLRSPFAAVGRVCVCGSLLLRIRRPPRSAVRPLSWSPSSRRDRSRCRRRRVISAGALLGRASDVAEAERCPGACCAPREKRPLTARSVAALRRTGKGTEAGTGQTSVCIVRRNDVSGLSSVCVRRSIGGQLSVFGHRIRSAPFLVLLPMSRRICYMRRACLCRGAVSLKCSISRQYIEEMSIAIRVETPAEGQHAHGRQREMKYNENT